MQTPIILINAVVKYVMNHYETLKALSDLDIPHEKQSNQFTKLEERIHKTVGHCDSGCQHGEKKNSFVDTTRLTVINYNETVLNICTKINIKCLIPFYRLTIPSFSRTN